MKKTIISSLLATFLCLSCQVTDERFEPAPRPVYESACLNVSLADNSVIPAGRGLSAWKLKDTTGYFYTSIPEERNGNFALNAGQKVPTSIAYAVYPEAKVDSLHNGVFYLELKDMQTAQAGHSYDCIYAGPVSANSAVLQKACAVIKFTVGCDNAFFCDLTTSLDTPLAGKARVIMTRDISMTALPYGGIKTAGVSGRLQKDSTYAIAVIPGTYRFTYSFKTEVGMPIGGEPIEEEYTAVSGEEIDLGLIGSGLPPVVPGNRIADAEPYGGYETIENHWREGSAISMLLEGENEKYEVISGAGTPQATFHGNEMSDWKAYGISPYDAAASVSGDVVSAVLAPSQSLTAGVPYAPALATTSMATGHMDFRNVGALLRFDVQEPGIAEIVFRGNGGEILSGNIDLVWNDGSPAYTVTDGADSLSIRPSDGETFAPGTYYASVLPQTLATGYTVMTKSVEGKNTGMSYYGSPANLVRSEIVNLGTVPEFKVGPMIVRAVTEGFTGDETIDASWSMGSSISVIASGNNERYALVMGAGSALGTFSGEEVGGNPLYGVSPYDANASVSSGSFNCTLPSSQQLYPGIANPLAVAVADEGTGNLVFKNVVSLLRFEIKGDNIGTVTIKGNNGEPLAGKIEVSWNGGEPSCSVVSGSGEITLKPVGGGVFAPGVYYASVLPQTFSNGVTVTMKPYRYATDNVVKFEYLPADLVHGCPGAIEAGRSTVRSIGAIDAGCLWSYDTTVRLAAIRGSDNAHGLYLDFSTGRAFFALGAYNYSPFCDITMITNGSNGIAPSSIKAAAGFTNETNLNKFGASSFNDQIGNDAWAVKSDNSFCYVGASELSDNEYKALSTVAQLKEIFDAHSADAVNSYYTPVIDCVTNANRVAEHKYLIVKTCSDKEGTGYGIIKFVGLAGGKWYIEFNYKWGLE